MVPFSLLRMKMSYGATDFTRLKWFCTCLPFKIPMVLLNSFSRSILDWLTSTHALWMHSMCTTTSKSVWVCRLLIRAAVALLNALNNMLDNYTGFLNPNTDCFVECINSWFSRLTSISTLSAKRRDFWMSSFVGEMSGLTIDKTWKGRFIYPIDCISSIGRPCGGIVL